MNAKELMKKYDENMVDGYKLKNIDDLYKLHDVEYTSIEGFSTLNKSNQEIFKYFIVAFFNSLGLKNRANLIPKRVLLVHKQWWWIEEEQEDGEKKAVWIKEVHKAIDSAGDVIETITSDIEEEYIEQLGESNIGEKVYLRFEFYLCGEEEWLHIEKDGQRWG